MPSIRKAFWRVSSLLGRNQINVGGYRYSIPPVLANELSRSAWQVGHYEAWMRSAMLATFSLRHGAFIDVGANVGQTLMTLLAIDPTRRYVGFEPQISGCHYIERFIRDNNLTAHTILPIGLSNNSGIGTLNFEMNNDVSASIVRKYRPEGFHSKDCFVPVITGDFILKHLGIDKVCMIKIDVEGGELDVIQGLRQTLKEKSPFLTFEVLPNFLWRTREKLDQKTIKFRNSIHDGIYDFLTGLSYIIYQVSSPTSLLEVSNLKAEERNRNYIAIREEQGAEFQKAFQNFC